MPLHSPIPTCGEFESQFQLILVHHSGHGNVGEEFISTEILPKVRSDSKLAPKAIQDHFKEAYGVEISYAKARRGEERALKVIDGSHDEAYSYLPKYCQEIQRSNPESNVQLDIDPTMNRFKRLFICFQGACAMGLASCRPLLGLDGTYLTNMPDVSRYNIHASNVLNSM